MTLLIQAENSARGAAGTAHAILYKSGATSSCPQRPNTWGGARNSASRESDYLSPLKAVELVEAAQQAMACGMPFNRHLTVHWARARLTDAEAAAATGRLVKLIRDWVRKKGGSVLYAWVRETGGAKGTHSHILLHVPDGLRLLLTRRWYRLATGLRGPLPRRAVKSVCIGGTARCGLNNSEWYQANLAKLLAYLLKGSDRDTAESLGLEAWGEGGTIIGKRVSTSANSTRPSRTG